jgi:DNA-binding CsgD family transcriptional regulator
MIVRGSILHMLVIYAFTREATVRPDAEEPRGVRAFFRDGGRPGMVMLASIILYLVFSFFHVLQYLWLPGLNATAVGYILLWFYILYTCVTLFLIGSRILMTAETPLHPLFFLRLFPRLAELSQLEDQHQYLTYLVVVLFCVYFLYALILIRMDRVMARNQPPDVDRAGERLGITAREEEVMRLAVRDLTCDGIADACFISVNTVKTHLNSIYRKLDVRNKAQLANKLREIGSGPQPD